jgi:hypothetical protein
MLFKRQDLGDRYSVVFEDDGRVAYAYLLHADKIVADVWLYNCAAAPEQPEWGDRSKAPFANPKAFASSEAFGPVNNEADIEFELTHGMAGQILLRVLIRGEYHAALVPGRKPGWSKLAVQDGPLASVLKPSDGFE